LAESSGGPETADAPLLFDAVRRAGELALALAAKRFERWTKSDGTPVTEADLAVDALLKEKLCDARPDYGWLSEETPDDPARLSRPNLWIADPIDGTRAYAMRSDEWCIAVALIAGGRPLIGAIYRPVRDEFYHAIAGRGAYLNGLRLALPAGRTLSGARVIGNAAALRRLAGKAKIEAVTSGNVPLAMRLAGVAASTFDAALSTTPKHDWDLAAGDLLVHEAGGIVTGLDGQSLTFNRPRPQQQGYIAAGPGLHRSLVETLGAT
jgi:myo-inositol-1(or 4)-monophosphatase